MTVVPGEDLSFVDMPGRRTADPLADVETASSVRIVELVFDPARTAHRHPHSEEIVVVIEGRGSVWMDGTRQTVGPGDVVIIPQGVPHATVPEGSMRLACFFPHPALGDNTEETSQRVVEQEGR